MMKTRLNGTERPKKDAGGLRHGLLVLAVLLLTCVLMAGAVSAEDLSDYWGDIQNVTWGSNGVLFEVTGDATLSANIPSTLVGNNKTIIQITGDSVTLDGAGYSIEGNGASTQSTQYGVYAGDAKDLTIKNLTVTGTFGSESYSSDVGGIFVTNTNAGRGGTITIENCDVSATLSTSSNNKKKAYGISVMANSTAITIDDCEVSGTFSGYQVYGIQALNRLGGTGGNPNTVLVKDCILSGTLTATNHNAQGICASSKFDNANGRGSGAGPIDVKIEGCEITADAKLSGNICHGIYGRAYNGNLVITSCTVDSSAKFTATVTRYGGAISVSDDGNAVISVTDCVAQNTQALNGISIVQGDTNTNPAGDVGEGVGTVQSSSISLTKNTLAGKDNSISVYVGNNAKIEGTTSLTYDGDGKQIKFVGNYYTENPDTLTVKDVSGNVQLIPGLSQNGVTWTGDDESGYTLTIDEAGSYKLMDAFTTTGSGIQITADGVTLDGSEGKITTADTLDGYILKVSVEKKPEGAKGVTLQNLDITGGVASGTTGNYGGVTVYAGEKKASVPVTLKDSIIDMSDVRAADSMNPAVYFVSASNSWISGNTIKAGSVTTSSTRCVVLDGGEGSTVTDNELHLGPTLSKEGSMGVQIKGSSTRNTVSGNTFIAPENDQDTDCRAVEITAVKGKDISSSITGNTINFPEQQKSSAVRVVLSSIGITEENTAVPITLTIENNKGSVKSEVSFWRSDEQSVTEAVKQSYIELKGNKYNPSLTKTEEYTMDAGFATDGTAKPSTNSVTNNNPNPPVSDGNMNNAYRVLFNDGATTLSVQTDLSSGDKLTKPETPVKDGYTFAGWYKDSACTQAWDFETGIPGDMTLYAKWTAAGSSGETEATTAPTATSTAVTTPQPTKTQSTTATTSAPEATTAAGVSPTLTQAPAPVAGALFGLLAAGVLLRRRFQ